MYSQGNPSQGAQESEKGPEGRHDQDPDPLSREGHQVLASRAHRLEVQRLQGEFFCWLLADQSRQEML